MRFLAWALLASCAAPDVAPPAAPVPAPVHVPADAAPAVAEAVPDAPAAEPEVWLKGSTHVHAKASGDSTTPIADIATWYEERGYDFLVLTDHNRVSAVETGRKLIVIPGIELTHNPSGCLPVGDKSRKCRIHVNALGTTVPHPEKLEWAERHSHLRIAMYEAALVAAKALGASVIQINHPQWFWGMTGDLLAELAQRGAALVEIANVQFAAWNRGDAGHPSTEQLWDDVLSRGLTMWGTASDDAHDYPARGAKKLGTWPAGGGWVVVKARRDPQAILAALAAGHFYASTGVVLARADVEADELVVAIDPAQRGAYTIDWIEAGKIVATDHGMTAHRALPATGYLRADVHREDGTEAWVQPARR